MSAEEAYSYQLPDELLYNLLTGREGRLGLFPEVEAYFKSQLEGLGSPIALRILIQGTG